MLEVHHIFLLCSSADGVLVAWYWFAMFAPEKKSCFFKMCFMTLCPHYTPFLIWVYYKTFLLKICIIKSLKFPFQTLYAMLANPKVMNILFITIIVLLNVIYKLMCMTWTDRPNWSWSRCCWPLYFMGRRGRYSKEEGSLAKKSWGEELRQKEGWTIPTN